MSDIDPSKATPPPRRYSTLSTVTLIGGPFLGALLFLQGVSLFADGYSEKNGDVNVGLILMAVGAIMGAICVWRLASRRRSRRASKRTVR